jgi:2-polyprenyl-3-methyl-5-hydroxy-6-metoxy-1,4-benzoquinol methylase
MNEIAISESPGVLAGRKPVFPNTTLCTVPMCETGANFSKPCVMNFMEERSKSLRLCELPNGQTIGTPEKHPLTPVAAYNAFAPFYSGYAVARTPYLRKVEDVVITHAPRAGSLLDVGAGDGSRALRIAQATKLTRVVLLEPSAGMRAQCPPDVEVWPYSASEIPDSGFQFDVITCLWNVLGHLEGAGQRVSALVQCRKMLAPQGMVFLDVSHRYNAESYGWSMTLLRMAGDFFLRSEKRGDVSVTWKAGPKTIHTTGHVFTHREIKRSVSLAGLKILKRWIISYETGRESKLPLRGHLLYQLARA